MYATNAYLSKDNITERRLAPCFSPRSITNTFVSVIANGSHTKDVFLGVTNLYEMMQMF